MLALKTQVNRQSAAAVRAVLGELSSGVKGGLGDRMVKAVGALDVKQAAKQFGTEGAEGGQKWKSLEDENKGYAAWKRRNWPGRKLMVWTGEAIRDSLTKASHPDHIARQHDGVLEFGSRNPLVSKHQKGEKYSTWQRRFMKEKTPRFPKGSKQRQKRDKPSGQFRTGKERVHKGRVVKGSNWFTFWFKEIPARPLVRKSPEQVLQLQRTTGRELLVGLAKAAGPRTLLGAAFAEAAGQIRVRG